MNLKLVIAGVLSVIFTSAAHAEWKTLCAEDGSVVEIAVDFQIEAVRIGPNGDASVIAKSTENGDEIGFSMKVTKSRNEVTPQVGKDVSVSILRCDLEIRSLGLSTKRFEELLRHQLHGSDQFNPALNLVGQYSAICSSTVASVAWPSIFCASGVGLTFDDSGRIVPGDSFSAIFFVDGPMKRLTGYFSVPGGYGGTSNAARVRSQWYKSREKINQPPGPPPR